MNNKIVFISIIIPVYNSDLYLEKLVDSILTQTYNNYEIIFINDGSTDNSLAIIKKYSKKHKNLRYKTINNSGPGIARKTGFQISKGDLIFFVDSDDYLPRNDILSDIAKCYEKTRFDILFFDFERLFNNTIKIHNTLFSKSLKEGKYNINYLIDKPVASALWCKIFVKSKIKSDFFYDSNNYEDCYLTYKYLNNCNSFYYLKKVLYHANRDNPSSLSKVHSMEKVKNTCSLLKGLFQGSKFKKAIMKISTEYYIGIRRLLSKNDYTDEEKEEIISLLNKMKKGMKLKIYYCSNIKLILKYAYYSLVDIIIRGTK